MERYLAQEESEDVLLSETRPAVVEALRRMPQWLTGQGCLLVDNVVLHQYPPQAHNVIALLDALEEWQWQRLPEMLDDPLTGKGDVDRFRRLYETVAALNRDQKPRRIEFVLSLKRTAVGWKWLEE